MNAATLQSKVYSGYAKAAMRIGTPCGVYRPTSALTAALDAANLVTSIPASFNAQDMNYSRPNGYGKATWYCLADGSQLETGDYLLEPGEPPFFVAALQPLLPILVVQCNRVVDLSRPHGVDHVGAQPYGGESLSSADVLATGFPASILQGTKGEKNAVNLPGDVRSPWWSVLLPNLPGAVYLRADDIMTDDLGRRYKISSAEQTDLGWRMSAMEAET